VTPRSGRRQRDPVPWQGETVTLFETVSPDGDAIGEGELRSALWAVLSALGVRRRIVVVPPDITRRHSFAGRITELAVEYYRDRIADVLPAPSSRSEKGPTARGS